MIVIVKLMGGLGNQMFQYAAARALTSGKIYFDYSFLNNNNISSEGFTARKFELQIFSKLKTKKLNSYAKRLLLTTNKKYDLFKLLLPSRLKKINCITDENLAENLNKKRLNGVLYLDGYFQNPVFFDRLRKSICSEFSFPKLDVKYQEVLNALENSNSVAIHIRRGDYLKSKINEHHGILPITYYQDAIGYLSDKLTNPYYFVFSDDPTWCAENLLFLDNKYIVSDDHQAWVDMYLMSQCKHHIIANSSFSWWGAWLNKNPDKIVIAPKRWVMETETNIIPEEWISL